MTLLFLLSGGVAHGVVRVCADTLTYVSCVLRDGHDVSGFERACGLYAAFEMHDALHCCKPFHSLPHTSTRNHGTHPHRPIAGYALLILVLVRRLCST